MTFAKEVAKIKKMFKDGQIRKNDFNSDAIPSSDLPTLTELMNEGLPEGYVPEFKKTFSLGAVIDVGKIEFQWHQASVDEHVDDTPAGHLFQILVIKSMLKINTRYDTLAIFNYFDENGRKCKQYLQEGDTITFRPTRQHSLMYRGEEILLAMRSVRKKPK